MRCPSMDTSVTRATSPWYRWRSQIAVVLTGGRA